MVIDRRQRSQVFALTWLAYGSYYLCRKGLAVSKQRLADTFGLSLATLGLIDTGYLVAYAAGQFASGLLCDALGSRRLVGVGMVAAAAATAAFGAGDSATAFAISFTLNGLFQSTGWPGVVKALTPWFPAHQRGAVMGLWATCYQVGGLAATALSTRMLITSGWRAAFLVPAVWTGVVGLMVLAWLRERPDEDDAAHPPAARRRRGWQASLAVLRTPLVWNLGAAYFCLKLIRYCLLFWLPLYLHRELGYSEGAAGYQSLAFEVGGLAGAVIAGAASDRLTARRGPVLVVMTIALAGALELYLPLARTGPSGNFWALALVGFMLFGPDAVLSSAAAQDLGHEDGAGTAAGVINGVGSVGAVAQGWITAAIAARWGWGALFHFFVGLSIACALVLTPYALGGARSMELVHLDRDAAPIVPLVLAQERQAAAA